MKLKMRWIFCSKKSAIPIKVNSNDNCTTFNDLNHDLIFEIFDYLSYTDILRSFDDLNNYLQEAIEHYPHSINLQIHRKYPTHIRSLKISISDHLLIFNSLKSSQLACLRTISLANLRTQDVLHVFNSIPYQQIECIYLGVCAFDKNYSTLEMLSTIQNHALSMSQYRLKQCYLKEKFYVPIENLPERLISLESLQIVACLDLFVVSQLISRASNLNYLHVSTLSIYQNQLVSNVSTCLHTLSFRPHVDCSVEELRIFLRECCSNLKKLIVELYIYRGRQPFLCVNKRQWLTIFPDQLKYFHLKSLSSSSIHLMPLIYDSNQSQLPMKEEILLGLTDIHRHYCHILIDAALVSTWINKD